MIIVCWCLNIIVSLYAKTVSSTESKPHSYLLLTNTVRFSHRITITIEFGLVQHVDLGVVLSPLLFHVLVYLAWWTLHHIALFMALFLGGVCLPMVDTVNHRNSCRLIRSTSVLVNQATMHTYNFHRYPYMSIYDSATKSLVLVLWVCFPATKWWDGYQPRTLPFTERHRWVPIKLSPLRELMNKYTCLYTSYH